MGLSEIVYIINDMHNQYQYYAIHNFKFLCRAKWNTFYTTQVVA